MLLTVCLAMRLVLAATLLALALPAAAQGSADDAPFASGLYQPGPPAPPEARVLFTDDGTFEMSVGLNLVAEGTYAATADHLVLLFETDDPECAQVGAMTGIYAWNRAEEVITLTTVDDECHGRARALSSAPLALVEPGE